MKHLKKYEGFDLDRILNGTLGESQEIEVLNDIFQEISDEGYDVRIRPNQRHIENDIVYGIQYDVDIKGVSNDFSDEKYYYKNYDISKIIISNIERLEKMGYEITYRSITNTLSNSITSINCKIQFWSRYKRPRQPRMSDTDVIAEGTGFKKYKGCDRKKKYQSIDDAMIKGKFAIAKYNTPLYTYLCRYCNSWHLTKSETKYKII